MKKMAQMLTIALVSTGIFLTGFYIGRDGYYKGNLHRVLSGQEFTFISDSECDRRMAKRWAEDLMTDIKMLQSLREEYSLNSINNNGDNVEPSYY